VHQDVVVEGSVRDDLRIFADACLWVHEAEAPVEVLRRANDAARLLVETSCSYCAVRDGDMLRLVAHSGFRDPRTAGGWRLPVGKGIGGRVVERGETLVVRDYQHDPRRERFSKALIDAEGLRCSIATPIRSGDRVVGVLYVAEHRLRRFTSGDLETMSLFGRLVGAALAAAEERQALQQRLGAQEDAARQAEEARRLLASVAAVLGDDGTLEAALRVLVDRLGGSAAVLDPFGNRVAHAGEALTDPVPVAVHSGGRRLGTLVVAPAGTLTSAERACLEQVADLVALSLLRERSALEDELGLGPRFLDDLLHGRLGDEEAVARQASILGIDLGAPRAVLCVGLPAGEPGPTPPPPLTRQAATVLRRAAMARRLEPVLDLRGRDMVLLVRVNETGTAALRTTVGTLLREAGTVLGEARLAGGLGRTCRRLGDFAESYREAVIALDLARSTGGQAGIRTHEDLGFYGLLAGAVDLRALDALAQRTLAALVRADRELGTRYLVTLAAYLRNDRHLKPAAAALGIHINTLRYRLARIENLLGVRLDDVEARFLLELAVRLVEARDGEAFRSTRTRRLSGRSTDSRN
jgi:sugar diacid utilization regulator/putative methionine-R-sulfoxide reductase with GAF domain